MQNSKNMSFDDMDKYEGKKTKFFNLEDDGDRAIIRFYHDNGDDIQKLPVHSVTVGDRKIKVACLRSPDEPEEACPLCESGELVSPKMFIKVLVYSPDKSGMYTRKPELQIWERGKSFRKQLQSLINRYASNKPLMDTIFEIERCGKKGYNKTTYQIYKADEFGDDECILPDPEDIEDFDALGTIVKDKSLDDMVEYLETGEFPKTEKKPDNRKTESNGNVTRRPSRPAPVEDDYEEEAPKGRRAVDNDTYDEDEESEETPQQSRRSVREVSEEVPARPRRRERL